MSENRLTCHVITSFMGMCKLCIIFIMKVLSTVIFSLCVETKREEMLYSWWFSWWRNWRSMELQCRGETAQLKVQWRAKVLHWAEWFRCILCLLWSVGTFDFFSAWYSAYCSSAVYVVAWCPIVRHVRIFCWNKWTYDRQNFVTFGLPHQSHHPSFSIPNVMAVFWRGPRNRGIRCGWGRQKNCDSQPKSGFVVHCHRFDIKFTVCLSVCLSVCLFGMHCLWNCWTDLAEIFTGTKVCSRHCVLHFVGDHPRGPGVPPVEPIKWFS